MSSIKNFWIHLFISNDKRINDLIYFKSCYGTQYLYRANRHFESVLLNAKEGPSFIKFKTKVQTLNNASGKRDSNRFFLSQISKGVTLPHNPFLAPHLPSQNNIMLQKILQQTTKRGGDHRSVTTTFKSGGDQILLSRHKVMSKE